MYMYNIDRTFHLQYGTEGLTEGLGMRLCCIIHYKIVVMDSS